MERNQIEKMFEIEEKNWWYVGKREIVFVLTKKFLSKDNEIRLLDVGCGTGIMLKNLTKYGEVFGVDISKIAIDFCKKRGLKNIFLSSATNLPFPNNYFDIVFSLDVLEHLENDMECLKEIKRVLKKNGILILSVPAFSLLYSYHDIALKHKRRYGKKELKRKINLAGFKIFKLTFTNFFIFPATFVFRTIKKLTATKKQLNDDIIILPKFLNEILIALYKIEANILKIINLPYGVSLLCVAKKTNN